MQQLLEQMGGYGPLIWSAAKALLVLVIGWMVAGTLAAMIRRRVNANPDIDNTLGNFAASMVKWAILLIVLVQPGGIMGGVFTATEGGAIAVIMAALLGFLYTRELKLSDIVPALLHAALTTGVLTVIIAFACRLVNITDLAFTALGAALVVIGGIGLFHAGGIAISDSPHLTIGISLFAMAAVLWLTGLLPLQLYMSKLAAKTVAAGQATMPEAYGKCVKLWTVLGIIATVLPLGTLWFMIAR